MQLSLLYHWCNLIIICSSFIKWIFAPADFALIFRQQPNTFHRIIGPQPPFNRRRQTKRTKKREEYDRDRRINTIWPIPERSNDIQNVYNANKKVRICTPTRTIQLISIEFPSIGHTGTLRFEALEPC